MRSSLWRSCATTSSSPEMGPEKNKMNLEGGVLYFTSPSDSSEWIKLGPLVSIPPFQPEADPEDDVEDYRRLGQSLAEGFTATFTAYTYSRAWRRIRRIMRRARQQAKRKWEKRKKSGRPLYDPETV